MKNMLSPPKLQDYAISQQGRLEINRVKIVFFDFDGVFTNNSVIVSENGVELAICNRFDGIGLDLLKSLSIKPIVISSEKNPIVIKRCAKLQIEAHNNVKCKSTLAEKIANEENCIFEECAFLGNDVNDIELFKLVGLPVCVNDAWHSVLQFVRAKTTLKGGKGAVRELCETVYSVRLMDD